MKLVHILGVISIALSFTACQFKSQQQEAETAATDGYGKSFVGKDNQHDTLSSLMNVKIPNLKREKTRLGDIIAQNELTIIDFWASWCGPCRMLSPVIAQVAAEAEGFKVASVNVDEEGELAQRYGVASIPTLIVFENGKAARTSVGVIPKDRILELVKG